MAVFTALCWAVLAIGLKLALKFVDPATIAWFRLAGAFLFLAAFTAWRKPRELGILRRPPLLGLLAGLGIAVNYYGYNQGVAMTSPSNAQIFIQIGPIMLIVIGIFFFGERPTRSRLAGFGLAALGLALFYRDQISHAIAGRDRYLAGNAMILIAALGWVVFAAIQKVLLRDGRSPTAINLVVNGVSALCLLPFVHWQVFPELSLGVWLLLIALAFNTVLAYGALGVAFKLIPASEVSMIITLNPILTLALMALLTVLEVRWIVPDVVEPLGWLGAAIVVSGAILAIGRGVRRIPPPPRRTGADQ